VIGLCPQLGEALAYVGDVISLFTPHAMTSSSPRKANKFQQIRALKFHCHLTTQYGQHQNIAHRYEGKHKSLSAPTTEDQYLSDRLELCRSYIKMIQKITKIIPCSLLNPARHVNLYNLCMSIRRVLLYDFGNWSCETSRSPAH
jgi:hypothetical protein